MSIAGWIKKENYGDSNVFFVHDVSVSHTDPATKYVMEACVSENDADKYVTNLKVRLKRGTTRGKVRIIGSGRNGGVKEGRKRSDKREKRKKLAKRE